MTSDLPGTTLEVDCRGMMCPQPIIELNRRLIEVQVGELIAVTAEDPAARYDVPAWCRMRGQEYVGEVPAVDGVARFVVRRLS